MQADIFIQDVIEHFPIQRPDPSRLFDGIRIESGHEKLEFFVHVEWPDLTLDMLDSSAGEFWQMSNVWVRYFLPGFMCVTAKHDIEFETYVLKTGTFIEIKEEQDALMTCMFSYWCSMVSFITEEWDIKGNIFHGLSAKQIDLVQAWLNHVNFKVLDDAYKLPEQFDFSPEVLNSFIKKARKYSI